METISYRDRRTVPRGSIGRAREWFRRFRHAEGYERHVVLLVVKSAVAAAVSWGVAHELMAAQAPAFAPFSAVLMMQVTVYQSVVQSLRYVVAVAAGVVLQGVVAFALGPNVLAFLLMALVALTLARWPKLDAQGSQVSTAAFFAFSLYVMATQTSARFEQLGQILLLVLIGCAVGGAVNMLVLPPMRYRSAERGIRAVCRSMGGLFQEVASGVREGDLDAERTSNWRHRAGELEKTVAQARTHVETAWESIYYNPRRSARRQRHTGFSTYGALVESLDRIARQLASMTRCLDLWYEETTTSPYADFLRDYAAFLGAVTGATNALCDFDAAARTGEIRELADCVRLVEEYRVRLADGADERGLPRGDHSRPYGLLLVEATRLSEEFRYISDLLGEGEEAARPA